MAQKPHFRPEIQALRTLAVALVVLYHLWPQRLSGGFIGVDVFFVISGFLITSHLLREVDSSGTISLSRFWARRIRRLLPAAFLVLAATLVATVMVLPQTQWLQTFREVVASAFYVENWLLAANSVDYLAAENAPSAVQHYWSLSVEEQFYILWPLILVGVAWWVRRRTRQTTPPSDSDTTSAPFRFHRPITLVLLLVCVASLVASIWGTATIPQIAYFATYTRAWEFGAGGLLALLALHPRWGQAPWATVRVRAVVSWVGLAAIIIPGFLYTPAMAFPGWIAAVPVLGTVLVIWAGHPDSRLSPTRYGAWRPIQRAGDLSYAIYLWHWPIIVLLPFALGHPLTAPWKVAIIAVTVALAWATERWVEIPLKSRASWTSRRRPAYIFAAAGMAAALVFSLGASAVLAQRQVDVEQKAAQASDCLGARSTNPDIARACADALADVPLVPTLATRADNTGGFYRCYNGREATSLTTCTFGAENPSRRLAIVGDSHATSLLPGLVPAMEQLGWSLDVFAGNGCQLTGADTCSTGPAMRDALLTGDYDAILLAGSRRYQPSSDELAAYWKDFQNSGSLLIPIADVPHFDDQANACIEASGGSVTAAKECSTPLASALDTYPDQYGPAAQKLGVTPLDLTQTLCGRDACPSVIGNTIVYRDSPASHLTATFSATLSDILGDSLLQITGW